MGFAKYVRPGEREAYSQEAREEGVRDLWPEPDGERSAYFPLEFVAPSSEANRRMLGYDAYSDPAHRSVMDRARDTGYAAGDEDGLRVDRCSRHTRRRTWT